MNETRDRFANRCLPMLIANQAGWLALNPRAVRLSWNGGSALDDVLVEPLDGTVPCAAVSHFGHGIVTWHMPYLFRTDPEYNLLVRGPGNWPKDGIAPLEGIVETGWSVATFTMNWKLTRPGLAVTFEADEPFCMLVPQRRGELESFAPRLRSIDDAPSEKAALDRWKQSRALFLEELKRPGSEAAREAWQKHYLLGIAPDGVRSPDHQFRLELREFEDE